MSLAELLRPGSYDGPDGPERVLPRGDVTDGVVRVGATVRRPHQAQSPAVAGYLEHLRVAGFDGAPRFLGRDTSGRDVLTFLAGQVASQQPEPWAADEGLLVSVADLVRRLLAASTGCALVQPHGPWFGDDIPPPDGLPPSLEAAYVVGHRDVTPQNVVFDPDGMAIGLIDFDLAGPTTIVQEAGNIALHWGQLSHPADRGASFRDVDPIARTRLIADTLALSPGQRAMLVPTIRRRAEQSRLTMRHNARLRGGGWARMWDAGAGDQIARRIDWLGEIADRLHRAVTAR